jgi:hypothetical protein
MANMCSKLAGYKLRPVAEHSRRAPTGGRVRHWRAVESVAGTLIDPSFEKGDLLRSKTLAFRRHHFVRVAGENLLNESALGALAGNYGRFAGVATFQEAGSGIHPESGLLLFGSVAFQAAVFQERLDVANIIRGWGVRGEHGGPNGGQESNEQQSPSHVSRIQCVQFATKKPALLQDETFQGGGALNRGWGVYTEKLGDKKMGTNKFLHRSELRAESARNGGRELGGWNGGWLAW